MIITFTGIDEKMTENKLVDFFTAYKNIEFGILYSHNNQGKVSKFPSYKWIDRFPLKNKCALHVCGYAVNDMVLKHSNPEFTKMAKQFGRIQLNFNCRHIKFNMNQLQHFIESWGANVITQHNKSNKEVLNTLPAIKNHQFLLDASGGRGIEASVPANLPDKVNSFGFAGGIGEDNIANIAKKARATGFDWIDMEGKLRTNDWIDPEIITKCIENAAIINKS